MTQELSFKKIVNKEKDLAGKWRVLVSVADTEAFSFKFNHEPTTDEVKIEVDKYIKNLAKQKSNELEMITNQIEELKARKAILEKEISKP